MVWKKSGKSLEFCPQKSVRTLEIVFSFLQRVQNGGIHVAGDNGTIQPIPFSFEPTGKNRMQQSRNC